MKKTPKSNRTFEDFLAHDLVDLTIDRKVLKDAVIGLILFNTYIIFHDYIKPHSIVQFGSSWKLIDLHSSCKIGDATRNAKKCNWGHCPPEFAVTLLNS